MLSAYPSSLFITPLLILYHTPSGVRMVVAQGPKLSALLKALKSGGVKGQLAAVAYWGEATPDVVQVSIALFAG